MTNTPFKARDIPRRIKQPDATPRLLSFPAPLFGHPWKVGLQAADHVPAAHRVLLLQHNGGGGGWLVGNATPADPLQNYPEVGVWRTVVPAHKVSLAPGCGLEMRVVALRSGMVQYYKLSPPGWNEYGVHGKLRVTIGYTNLDAETDTAVAEIDLAPSLEDNGVEPFTVDGGSWSQLLFKHVALIAPAGVKNGVLSEIAKWSEDTTLTITVEHLGGSRVIQCAIQEVSRTHVVDDTEESPSVHGWPSSLPPPARPQTESSDGADYEEHRFGTARAMAVAERQGRELGPVIASWTSWAETLAEVTDTTPDPIQVSSTTWVGLSVGSSHTEWSADAPGYAVSGHYARRSPENLDTRVSGAAAIPVRVRAQVRWTGTGFNTGYIRWQTSARSWLNLVVSQASVDVEWTDLTTTGWLETTIGPDDPDVNLMDFTRVTGGTMEVRAGSVEWGDREVAG